MPNMAHELLKISHQTIQPGIYGRGTYQFRTPQLEYFGSWSHRYFQQKLSTFKSDGAAAGSWTSVPGKKILKVRIICFGDSRQKNRAKRGIFFAASAAKIWYNDFSSASESVFPGIFGDFLSPFLLTKTRCFSVNQFHMWRHVDTYIQIYIFTSTDVHVWYQRVDQSFNESDK